MRRQPDRQELYKIAMQYARRCCKRCSLLFVCFVSDFRSVFGQVANHLFPKGYTCSGDKAAVETLKGLCEKEGALQARFLKTSGAFHTSLMEPAGTGSSSQELDSRCQAAQGSPCEGY